MIKYTKKQQKFISDLYGHDLKKFEERLESLSECEGYENYVEEIKIIFQYSRELIRKVTTNSEKMFNLAERLQEELQQKHDLLDESSETSSLSSESKEECDNLYWVIDSLRILNNLHPDRIMTWEEVTPIDYVIYPK